MGLFDFSSKGRKENFPQIRSKKELMIYLRKFVPDEIAEVYSEMAEQAGKDIDLKFQRAAEGSTYQFVCPVHENSEIYAGKLATAEVEVLYKELKSVVDVEAKRIIVQRQLSETLGSLVTVKIFASSDQEYSEKMQHFMNALKAHRELFQKN